MGRIEADITLESWLFGFRPCSGQGQFALPTHTYSPLDLKFDFMVFDAKPYRNNSRPYSILP